MPDRERSSAAPDGTDDATSGAETGERPGASERPEAADGSGAGDRSNGAQSSEQELPAGVVEEAERLTRLARRAADDAEARAYREERATVLAEHDFAARLREDDDGDVLVCHPTEWLVDDATGAEPTEADAGADASAASQGAIDPEYIDDVDRAVEVHLEGSDDPEDWESVAEHNDEVAAAVRSAHGDVHGDNAAELAAYASNHYAKPLQSLTAEELEHFREEYYTRNVWPTDEQAAALDRSLELVYEELSVPLPYRDTRA